MILESSSLRSQVSLLRFHRQDFFLNSLINLTISEIWLPSSTYDFSPTREAKFLDTAIVYEYVSHIPLGLVSEQTGMIHFSSTSYDRVQQYYCLFTALLQTVFFTPREGSHII